MAGLLLNARRCGGWSSPTDTPKPSNGYPKDEVGANHSGYNPSGRAIFRVKLERALAQGGGQGCLPAGASRNPLQGRELTALPPPSLISIQVRIRGLRRGLTVEDGPKRMVDRVEIGVCV
jgi:hypothetical protein